MAAKAQRSSHRCAKKARFAMLIINAEVDGVRLDVRFQDKILELSSSIQPAPGIVGH